MSTMSVGNLVVFGAALSIGFLLSTTNGFAEQKPAYPEGEAGRKKYCADLKASYDYKMAHYREDPARRSKSKHSAESIRILAEGNGCKWAAM
jgi:hypothetical protein